MKTLGLQRWTVGDAVRLAAPLDTHLGRLAADTPGEVVKLEFGRRVCVRFAAGDAWVDQDALRGATVAVGGSMSLASIYTELHRQAARTGTDRRYELKGGARIAVRVQVGVVTLTISRKGKRVGDTELITFRRECGVPATATRYPIDEQATRTDEAGAQWWCVTYRWGEA